MQRRKEDMPQTRKIDATGHVNKIGADNVEHSSSLDSSRHLFVNYV